MKQATFIRSAVCSLSFLLCVHIVNAELLDRGTDSHGNRLIYDRDLNITWYDYSNAANTWQNQMQWASGLKVEFGGTVFDDWRLPSTTDGPYVFGYDGTTTAGFNITGSELGHLFYTELGNQGAYDTSGNLTSCHAATPVNCLTNTGPFLNLHHAPSYWSGTKHSEWADAAWDFLFSNGRQSAIDSDYEKLAIAVRNGDVVVVPEP
ncbi:MAG TPA: hypothetical protein DDX85_01910 [Nitrospiraceae bacterium]|nr:hypothetical protein [Nitrospiraceae bacterium]